MKKLSFFVGITLCIFAVLCPTHAHAATTMHIEGEMDTTPTMSTQPAKTVQVYTLPYPGLLPNNPLYFLKSFRDVLLEAMISDPSKKSQFYVLQADKFLAMSQQAFEQKNWPMTLQTTQMSLASIDKALGVDTAAMKKGVDMSLFMIDRLKESATYRHTIIHSYIDNAPSAEKDTWLHIEEQAHEQIEATSVFGK